VVGAGFDVCQQLAQSFKRIGVKTGELGIHG
jgi:hypothetical protein